MKNPTPHPAMVSEAITYVRKALDADLQPLTGGPGWVIRPDGANRQNALVFPNFLEMRAYLRQDLKRRMTA